MGRNSWVLTPLASSFKGYGYVCVSFGWCRPGISPSGNTKHCTQNKLKSPERKSSLPICHVESEAAWNKDPHNVESSECKSSKLDFGTFRMEYGKEQRKDDFETPIFRQASFVLQPSLNKILALEGLRVGFFKFCWLERCCLNWLLYWYITGKSGTSRQIWLGKSLQVSQLHLFVINFGHK